MANYFHAGHKIEVHRGARFFEYTIFSPKGLEIVSGFAAMATTGEVELCRSLEKRVLELVKDAKNYAVPMLDRVTA